MSDFKTGLLLESVQNQAWWGKYTWLENLQPPGIQAIKDAQRKILANEEQALAGKCKAANEFLQQLKRYDVDSLEIETNKAIDDAIGSRLMKLINAGLNREKGTEDAILKEGATYQSKQEQIVKNLTEMENILRSLASTGKTNTQFLDRFLNTMKRAYSSVSIKEGTTRQYVQNKAKAAEYATAIAINQNPEWRAIVTGNWVDELGQQLVEDILVFSEQTIQLNGHIPITVRITGRDGKTKTVTKKLKEVLEIKGTVRLASNDDYEKIRQLKLFAVQSKSGIDQNIFTQAQRNAIKLGDIGGFGKAQDIYHLFVLDMNRKDARWFKNSDEQYSEHLHAFADMQLSQNILKTVLSKNEIYFTTEGFMTAREWLIKKNRYVTFKDKITNLRLGMMTEPLAISALASS